MLIDDANIEIEVVAASSIPNPASGKVKLFFDSTNNNRLSQKDSSGNVIDLVATTPRITVSTSSPISPQIGDIWIDTN